VRAAGLLAGVLFLCAVTSAVAAPVQVQGMRMWPAPDNTRLVFDLSAPVVHQVFTLTGPDRLVIDLKNARMPGGVPAFDYAASMLRGIRYAPRGDGDLRVVLDLKKSVKPRSFVLKPNREYGHRLVIDLYDAAKPRAQPRPRAPRADPGRPRDIVIAIDAGHGGDDPGAIGPRGTREKDVVLQVAKRLKRLIDREYGMRAVMIREGDYFVGLSRRVQKAREAHADLFISLHADAFDRASAHGSSVYILAEGNASSDAARWLAENENASDVIGGVSLVEKDDLLKYVLVDMMKASTIQDSHQLASDVLAKLKGITPLHKPYVEQAGFRVLRSPDVPSILVEMAFISNPKEERKLRNGRHQAKLARALLRGIRSYFRKNPLEGTLLAARPRRHVIARGDTLSEIASRYRVSVGELRAANGLKNDVLVVGKVLRIPWAGS